jgi:hypothetical protein
VKESEIIGWISSGGARRDAPFVAANELLMRGRRDFRTILL